MNYVNALHRTILLCRDYVADLHTDEEIALNFSSFRVLCAADEMNLSCNSGQTALVTLVSLMSRMGMQVDLVLPDVPIANSQTPFQPGPIRSALVASSERLMPGAAITAAAGFTPDIVFTLGTTQIDCGDVPLWRLSGGDWSGYISADWSTPTRNWDAECPVGGMVSALLGANEAFKTAIRKLILRRQADLTFFEPSKACGWDFGATPLPKGIVDLGTVDMISAGAITQAALYALHRFPRLKVRGRLFDDDQTAASNLNRNMLTFVEDVGLSKVDTVSARCEAGFKLDPLPRRFEKKSIDRVRLATRVLVGVDDIPSRWAVQQEAPGWVGVGGTSHFGVSSSSHCLGQACCGCLHPVDDGGEVAAIPTVSFVSLWSGLSLAVRLIREALGNPYPASQQQLWLTPLRMDLAHAGIWSPVPARKDCPVGCASSRQIGRSAA